MRLARFSWLAVALCTAGLGCQSAPTTNYRPPTPLEEAVHAMEEGRWAEADALLDPITAPIGDDNEDTLPRS